MASCERLDCAGGTILVVAQEDEIGAQFSIEVASATIRQGDVPLTCADLRVGDQVEVKAETADGFVLVNAQVVLEDREGEMDDGSTVPPISDPVSDDALLMNDCRACLDGPDAHTGPVPHDPAAPLLRQCRRHRVLFLRQRGIVLSLLFVGSHQREHDQRSQHIAMARLELYDAMLDEFDIEGVLDFAKVVATDAGRLWIEARSISAKRSEQSFFR